MNHKIQTILCVDDEPMNLRLLEFMLGPRGYEVATAEDGKTALAKMQSEKIDLVLLDVMMPEMDGFAVCRQIKDSPNLRHIPVIMLTGLVDKKNRIKGIEAGVDDFLCKPFDQAEVLARITMLLKVKELNDDLTQAYDNITRLVDFGKCTIRELNPLDFDFLSQIDKIVRQMIRHTNDPIKKPEAFLVCIEQEKNGCTFHEWHRYESVFGTCERTCLEISLPLPLAKGEDALLLFSNSPETDDGVLHSLLQKFKDHNIPVHNLVCYISTAVSIFAINYGRDVSAYDAAVLNSIVMQTLYLKSLSGQVKDANEAFEYTVHALARAAEANDEDTGKHTIRVGHYCALMAERLGMPEEFINAIRIQAALHDVGKIHIPAAILKKSGPFTDEDWREIKKHPILGAKIIGDHPRFNLAKTIALTHHEKWDGSGYPYGLRGEDIPLAGRIMTIADQYDALRYKRVYKLPYDHPTAFTILTKGDGRTLTQHFDPALLKLLTELSTEFDDTYNRFSD